jgi:hypothetical protein
MRALIAAGLLLTALACGEAPLPELARPFELRAVTPAGEAVPGVRAWLGGALLGETSSDGVLRATLRGRAHQRIILSWACPAAYEPPAAERELAIDPSAASTPAPQAPLKLEARCTPLDIEAALVVRASGAPASGLPVVVRDEMVARTDAEGFAHVLLRARRGSALTVGLDTHEHPALVPASPLETFQLGDADTILLFDRKLATPAVKPKSARRDTAKKADPRVPIRIQ